MINIYTDRSLISSDMVFIFDVEREFRVRVAALQFEDIDLEVMKEIDKAVLLDKKTGAIRTPFGVTSIENLSTGCKCVLFYLYLTRHSYEKQIVLNITECGRNAILLLCTICRDFCDAGIIFCLEHTEVPYDDGFNFRIDDRYEIDSLLYIRGK